MSDNLIINRNGVIYEVSTESTGAIEDTDLLLVNRNGVTYTVTGDQISKGGSGPLGSALPPFTSQSGPSMTLTNSDGKVEFSLNGTSWSSSLTVPPETIYYCTWTNDILSAAHNSNYETLIAVDYPNLGSSQDVEIKLKIDKLPDPFEFTDIVDVNSDTTYISNTISPLETINAPTAVWGSSDAINAQVAIGDDSFQSIPSAPGSLYVNRNTRIRVRHTTGSSALTDYSTTLNIGYGTGAGEFETSTYTTTTLNSVVNQPTITSPGNNDFVDTETFTITASAFTAVNAGTHKSTQWQVASDAAFSNIIEQETSTSELESWTPSFGLSYVDQVAYVRVRYTGTLNDITSNWSPTVQFTPQQWWLWRVQLKLKGGHGVTGNGSNSGGNGGAGKWFMETSVFSYNPPDSVSGTIGNYATSSSGASGYGSGGSAQTGCSNNNGGGGGGSSSMKISGTVVAVSGGGGGGGGGDNQNGSGGSGGYPGSNGGGGGSHDSSPGGSGGGQGSGGGGGGYSYCGDNGRRSGGGGGGGGGGGNGGQGDVWSGTTTAGGGGGGGGYYNASASPNWSGGTVTNITNSPEIPSGYDGRQGYASVTLYKAPRSAPTSWQTQNTYTDNSGGYSVTLSSLKS